MILITNYDSLLAKSVVEKFSREGEKVRCYDQYKPSKLPADVEFVQGDLFSIKRLDTACSNVDTIIHLMDMNDSRITGRGKMKRTNIRGTQNILNVAKKNKIKRIIFLSTYAVYAKSKALPITEGGRLKPQTAYGRDKLKAERLCETFAKRNQISLTIIRPSMIIGPDVSDTSALITLYMAMGLGQDNLIYVSDDDEIRFQLISPDDAADAFFKVYRAGAKTRGMILNIGSDNVPTHIEEIKMMKEKKKIDLHVKEISPFRAFMLSLLFKPSKVNYFTKEHRVSMFSNIVLDCSKIKSAAGWAPVKTNLDILSETMDWYLKKIKK